VGRLATIGATVAAIFTAFIASGFSNMMDYLQTLFSFFNAPLFATFILGMFWKRMTPTAGWMGLVCGTGSAIVVFALHETDVFELSGQGASFVAAGAAFVVDILVSIVVTLMTSPKPESELRGLVYSLTPKSDFHDENEGELPWYQQPKRLALISLIMVIILNIAFW